MTETTKAIRPPGHFSEKAKVLWRRINSEYLLEAESLELLRVALENNDLGDVARDTLRREGLVITDAKGATRKHPASDAVKLHDGMFCRALKQLALDVVQPGKIGRPPGR